MKLFLKISGLILMFVLISVKSAYSEPEDKGSLLIKKCRDFEVDGKGSSPEWNKTEWVKLTLKDGGKADYPTRVKVMYSETGIYFLYDCVDKKLTTTLVGDFQNIFTEDVVEMFLWPDETFPVYFEYELSPTNYELPIIIPNYKGTFYGWQPWHYEGERRTRHATSVTGGKMENGASVEGWKAEFFVPFKLLVPLNNVPPVSGTKWRANMYRIDYDNGTSHFYWQKVSKSFHEYNNYGTFIFE